MFCQRLTFCAVFAAIGAGLLLPHTSQGDDPIVRIEEDWDLQVKDPEPDVTAPQIITAFATGGDIAGIHATFEINHISSVDFAPGGLHLSTWNGDTHLAVIHSGDYVAMSTNNENVTWTQAIEIKDGRLYFEIISGASSTWGDFGAVGSLRLSLDTSLTDLSAYDPAISAAESEVSYAGNRVQSLTITKVRYIHASGAVTTENVTRSVHQSND